MVRWGTRSLFVISVVVMLSGFVQLGAAGRQGAPPALPNGSKNGETVGQFVNLFCVECHNGEDKTAGLDFDAIDCDDLSRNSIVWEKVVKKLVARQMPPADAIRPSRRTYDSIVATLTGSLDRAAAVRPEPGRTDTFRRLTRREYQNAIRDLLAVDIDAKALLPNDESSHGFDNVTVGDLSPTLLDRYITAAALISRIAVGSSGRSPGGDTIRVRPDLTQEAHVEGLPVGTRGGAVIPYTFPQDGEYEIQLRLARDRNEHVEGLHSAHVIDVLVDRKPTASFNLTAPKTERDHQTADAHLKTRIRVTAGAHKVGVTFVRDSSSLLETKRQPFQAHYNMHRHPRITPALFQVSITGPFDPQGAGDTASRRRIAVCRPSGAGRRTRVRGTHSRRVHATGLPATGHRGRPQEPDAVIPDCSHGGELRLARSRPALSRRAGGPELYRIEADPPGALALNRPPNFRDSRCSASRLSFFLWSSIPDDRRNTSLAERAS